ncbi:transposase [Streptomyces sp. NPDC052036]|uniref:transposase n=1 Tax=Streptomyces sp. NPDC052036 TaxID=3155171 RepID=UPI0034202330
MLFSVSACRPCTMRQACINTPNIKRPRERRLRRHNEHHALQAARAEQQTDAWKKCYKVHELEWALASPSPEQVVRHAARAGHDLQVEPVEQLIGGLPES